MEPFESEFLRTFADAVQEESTHIIECVQGKKKWLFYFVDGQLALTKSNLKQEQTDAVKESHPDISTAEIPLVQATMRVKQCITAESIAIKSSSKMPDTTVSTMDAMIGGLQDYLNDNEDSIETIRGEMEQIRPKLIRPIDTTHPASPISWPL